MLIANLESSIHMLWNCETEEDSVLCFLLTKLSLLWKKPLLVWRLWQTKYIKNIWNLAQVQKSLGVKYLLFILKSFDILVTYILLLICTYEPKHTYCYYYENKVSFGQNGLAISSLTKHMIQQLELDFIRKGHSCVCMNRQRNGSTDIAKEIYVHAQ